MQFKNLLILLFLFIISLSLSSQTFEKIYFDKNWKLSNSSSYKYYREWKLLDSIINIKDYYKNGNIQWEGTIINDTSLLEEGFIQQGIIGKSVFYRKNKIIESIEIHQPKKNLNEIRKYYPDIDKVKDSLFEHLYFEVYFHKNGKIKSYGFGYEPDYGLQYLSWSFFNKKGRLYQLKKFGKTPNSYIAIWFDKDGKIIQEIQFKNNLKDGHYKYYYNNIVKDEGFYRKGKKHGKFISYRLNTKEIKNVKKYKNGKRIK